MVGYVREGVTAVRDPEPDGRPAMRHRQREHLDEPTRNRSGRSVEDEPRGTCELNREQRRREAAGDALRRPATSEGGAPRSGSPVGHPQRSERAETFDVVEVEMREEEMTDAAGVRELGARRACRCPRLGRRAFRRTRSSERQTVPAVYDGLGVLVSQASRGSPRLSLSPFAVSLKREEDGRRAPPHVRENRRCRHGECQPSAVGRVVDERLPRRRRSRRCDCRRRLPRPKYPGVPSSRSTGRRLRHRAPAARRTRPRSSR